MSCMGNIFPGCTFGQSSSFARWLRFLSPTGGSGNVGGITDICLHRWISVCGHAASRRKKAIKETPSVLRHSQDGLCSRVSFSNDWLSERENGQTKGGVVWSLIYSMKLQPESYDGKRLWLTGITTLFSHPTNHLQWINRCIISTVFPIFWSTWDKLKGRSKKEKEKVRPLD